MQNRYVGDVGDFANNGLLRWLCGKPELEPGCPDSPSGKLRLGIAQYLHHDNSRGGNVPIPDRLRTCDEHLHNTLVRLRDMDNRSVLHDEYRQVVPVGERYHIESRSIFGSREEWLNSALDRVIDSQIVFLNPDNGIAATANTPFPDSPKHVYLSDTYPYIEKRKSLIIYHHYAQGVRAEQRIANEFRRLAGWFGALGYVVYALRFQRRPPRFYFLLVHGEHRDKIRRQLITFMGSNWCTGNSPNFTFCDQDGNRINEPQCLP